MGREPGTASISQPAPGRSGDAGGPGMLVAWGCCLSGQESPDPSESCALPRSACLGSQEPTPRVGWSCLLRLHAHSAAKCPDSGADGRQSCPPHTSFGLPSSPAKTTATEKAAFVCFQAAPVAHYEPGGN